MGGGADRRLWLTVCRVIDWRGVSAAAYRGEKMRHIRALGGEEMKINGENQHQRRGKHRRNKAWRIIEE